MSNRQITIAIDAMGGEDSPLKALKGIEIFSKKYPNVILKIFGKKTLILNIIAQKKILLNNYELIDCAENVSDEDSANTILRSRKNSSIYKGLIYVKNNPNSGFVSAGNILSVDTVVFSGDNLIKLTSQNNQLDLKRKSDLISLKKKDDLATEKRRHKRRRKVRPPKQGK